MKYTNDTWVELEEEIIKAMEHDTKDQVPVLVNESLSPEILTVLFELFQVFDKDGDGCLNSKELDFFVFSTNGQHPPQSFIDQMGQRFGADEYGSLTKKGFLVCYVHEKDILFLLTYFLKKGVLFGTNIRRSFRNKKRYLCAWI